MLMEHLGLSLLVELFEPGPGPCQPQQSKHIIHLPIKQTILTNYN